MGRGGKEVKGKGRGREAKGKGRRREVKGKGRVKGKRVGWVVWWGGGVAKALGREGRRLLKTSGINIPVFTRVIK